INEKGLQEGGQDTAEQLRDMVLDNTAMGPLLNILHSVTTLLTPFSKKNSTHHSQYKSTNALPIRDHKGKLVASVYKTPQPALRFNDHKLNNKQQLQLLAIGWVMMGSSLA
ncbi:hypothetical protein JYU12_02995, partial [bacterium AH-315-K03]|nr:hypothetical protein [bacterium AH-315-K03]